MVELYGGASLAEETARLLEYERNGWRYDRVGPNPGRSQVEMQKRNRNVHAAIRDDGLTQQADLAINPSDPQCIGSGRWPDLSQWTRTYCVWI